MTSCSLRLFVLQETINVATKEEFTIPGYNKLTFTPESAIKELVTKVTKAPSTLKTDNHPLEKLNEQATEIVDILADLGQSPKEAKVESRKSKGESQKAEGEREEKVVVVEKEKKEDSKPCRPWLTVGLTILCILAILSTAFLFFGDRFIQWLGQYTPTTQIEESTLAQEDIAEVEDSIIEVELSKTSTSELPYPCEYKQFIATERLPKGSRLAWLARKYYNERDMWVFIYEANREHIEHPSHIIVGTVVRVPKLPQELQDLSNPETRQLVDSLIYEYTK